MKEFLITYKELIISCFTLLLTVISIIVKRKPKTLDDFSLAISEVLGSIPELVNYVEEPKNGSQKKSKVIAISLGLMKKTLGRDLSQSEIDLVTSKVSSQIEEVLSTPRKKSC